MPAYWKMPDTVSIEFKLVGDFAVDYLHSRLSKTRNYSKKGGNLVHVALSFDRLQHS